MRYLRQAFRIGAKIFWVEAEMPLGVEPFKIGEQRVSVVEFRPVGYRILEWTIEKTVDMRWL
jgi:hypothetical protein